MLGHSSIRITEKHYSSWVRARQEQAEADVRRSWLKDPLALMEGVCGTETDHEEGTREVHEKSQRFM